MRSLAWTSAAALSLLIGATQLSVGCGGDVRGAGGGGAAGGSGTTTGTTSTGSAGGNSGDCDSDADCPGSACVEITPGGFRVCRTDYPEATVCTGSGLDECCTTADCPAGACLIEPIVPYCGGPAMLEYNVCAQDQCASDTECGDGVICAPAGTLGGKVRACAAAGCTLDTDCAAEAGGICAPYTDPCCSNPTGLFCVYPSDGCRSSNDCKSCEYCEIAPDGRARCVAGFPACPA
jgi:hypothetical protein